MTPWIQTSRNRALSLPPAVEEIVLIDLVCAVSHLARYTGHAGAYYVGQHLVLGARALRDEGHSDGVQRAFIGHDLHEAICGDLSSPGKRAVREIYRQTVRALVGENAAKIALADFPDPWKVYEDACAHAVRVRFGFPREMPEAVHNADLRMLATERREFFGEAPPGHSWLPMPEPYDFRIQRWSPDRCIRELADECIRLEVY